jgi:hypothetical protein
MDDGLVPADRLYETVTKEVVSKRQLIREMVLEGVFESKSASFLLPGPKLGMRPRSTAIGNFMERWNSKELSNVWSGMMDTLEKQQRIGMFMDARMRRGFSGVESGRMVREAYFDWKFPPSLRVESVVSHIPLMMFGSMWKNAAAHTLSALADPKKAYNVISMWKTQEIGANALSSGDTESHRIPWWGADSSLSFVTSDASDWDKRIGKSFLGAETGNLAYSLPEFISLGLVTTAVTTALMLGASVRNAGNTPITRENFSGAVEDMISVSSQFLDPYLLHATQTLTGSGVIRYGGGEERDVRMNADEATVLMHLTELEKANGWDYSPSSHFQAQIKDVKSTGGTKMVGDQNAVTGWRLVPGFTRVTRAVAPMIREAWGDDSAQVFQAILLKELGKAPQHVPTEDEALKMRDARLFAQTKRIGR